MAITTQVVQIRALFQQGVGRVISTGLNIVPDTDTTAGERTSMREAVEDWWALAGKNARASWPIPVNLVGATSKVIFPLAEQTATELSTFTPTPGTRAAEVLPPQCSPVFSLRSTNASRSGRGRMYFPPLADTDVDTNGTILSAFRPSLLADMRDLFTAIDESVVLPITLVVFSRKLGDAFPVTQTRLGSQIDIQRRRRLRDTQYEV